MPDERTYLRDLRKKNGLTQQQVASYLGVTKATISKFEKGQRHVGMAYLNALAFLYNVDPMYILFGPSGSDEGAHDVTAKLHEKAEKHKVNDAINTAFLATHGKEIVDPPDYFDSLCKVDEAFTRLNHFGISEAVKRVEELTEVPKYQRAPIATPPDASQPSQSTQDPAPEENPAEGKKTAPGDAQGGEG